MNCLEIVWHLFHQVYDLRVYIYLTCSQLGDFQCKFDLEEGTPRFKPFFSRNNNVLETLGHFRFVLQRMNRNQISEIHNPFQKGYYV